MFQLLIECLLPPMTTLLEMGKVPYKEVMLLHLCLFPDIMLRHVKAS